MNANRTRLMSASDLLPRWLRAPLLPVAIGKEFQALMPYWFVSLLAACFTAMANDELFGMGLVVLLLANSAIGATSVGHEFSCRTIGLLLSQPVSRAAVWRRKLLVVALAIATASLPLLLRPLVAESGGDAATRVMLALGAGLSGLCVAPFLTAATRSALAGTVFASGLPLVLLLAANLLVAALQWGLGWNPDDPVRVAMGCLVLLLIAHWLAAWWAGRRLFLRLDAIDSAPDEFQLPGWTGSRSKSARSGALPRGVRAWPRQWLRKEFRLQQTSLLVAAWFLAGWLLNIGAHEIWPSVPLAFLGLFQPVYSAFMALLIGALGCAEERHHGMLEAQLILPVSPRRQWYLKAAACHGLALGLAVILPAVLRLLTPADPEGGPVTFELKWTDWFLVMTPMTVLFTSFALYASSVSRSTVRALLVSILVTMALVGSLPSLLRDEGLLQAMVAWWGPVRWYEWLSQRFAMICLICAAGLALTLLAFANYRTLEQRAGRVVIHLGGVLAGGLLALLGYVSFGLALGQSQVPVAEAAGQVVPPPASPRGRLLSLAELEPAARLGGGDVSDWPGLVRRWQKPTDLVSAWIAERLPAATRDMLQGWAANGPLSEALRARITDGLNELIRGPLFYDEARFTGVRLRMGLRDWIGLNPEPPVSAVLNLMLLEDAYPGQFTRKPLEVGVVSTPDMNASADAPPTNRGTRLEVRELRGPAAFRARWIPGETNNGPGRPGFRMDVRLMQRYGLLPSGSDRAVSSNALPAAVSTNTIAR